MAKNGGEDTGDTRKGDEFQKICTCNAHSGQHRHLDRGIVPEEVFQADEKKKAGA